MPSSPIIAKMLVFGGGVSQKNDKSGTGVWGVCVCVFVFLLEVATKPRKVSNLVNMDVDTIPNYIKRGWGVFSSQMQGVLNC